MIYGNYTTDTGYTFNLVKLDVLNVSVDSNPPISLLDPFTVLPEIYPKLSSDKPICNLPNGVTGRFVSLFFNDRNIIKLTNPFQTGSSDFTTFFNQLVGIDNLTEIKTTGEKIKYTKLLLLVEK